jgi:hypothetical protein
MGVTVKIKKEEPLHTNELIINEVVSYTLGANVFDFSKINEIATLFKVV